MQEGVSALGVEFQKNLLYHMEVEEASVGRSPLSVEAGKKLETDNRMKAEFEQKLRSIAGEGNVLIDEPMAKHTTFRVGGPADYFVTPDIPEKVRDLTDLCRKKGIPYYILGNGSNLLVSDKGYRGVILQIYKNMEAVGIEEGGKIRAQAGALLSKVAAAAYEASLTGFEFAAGIPGTIGGAAVMNAGAYGGELKDVFLEATVLTPEGEIQRLTREEMQLGYRTSAVAKNGYIVLEVRIQLSKGSQENIRALMEDLKKRRIAKQPLEYPSAGSTFKRPEGYFAGKLIQDAGLRGFTVGGAQVSEKHCGFVINKNEAKAKDIVSLIEQVKEKVDKAFGVMLETEVKYLGEME